MSETFDFEKDIDKLLERSSFVPFEIVLSSGDRYEVADPRWVAMGGNVVVVVHPQAGLSFFRKSQIVAVNVREPQV
jgi:hypothetical protein